MAQALEGIRVLDFTIWQQGPVATTALADMGAEVVKIEERV
ncbi:MAG: CoA transferase, partial [Chloroflexota bacterium]